MQPGNSAPHDRPTQLGPFKVLDVIGEGGMGTVYLGEQKEPIRRRAAVKVIKLGMDSKAVLARFEAERKALSLMEHSCIAKVFDAGLTPSGQPWFAMEFVKGIPITDYCDQNKLSLEQRIELFQKVCSGVQHAHLKGVMHRDLKPGNVLVTLQDGKPMPKIIDFGLAKATDHRLVEATIYTEHGTVVGTPEYMSPEQAGLGGLDVDTRTDVYSLGVLLYELLTGELPFSRQELHAAGYLEMQRVIREQEPTKPSTKVTAIGERAAVAAQMRAMSRGEFAKTLRGDLDWITLRALEKDRTRRYDTAQELAADLERYLRVEPVLATPPSFGYRAQKFVRKYRVQCVAAAAVMVAIVAGGVGTAMGYADAREQERVAKQNETKAEAAAELATQRAEQISALAEKDRIYADLARLQDAESRAEALFPAVPSRIRGFEEWIAEVEPICARLPVLEADLAAVRQRGKAMSSEARDAAKAEIAGEIGRLQKEADEAQPRERRALLKDIADAEVRLETTGYEFDERADADRHLQLAKLVVRIRACTKGGNVYMRGAMTSVRARLAQAQALAASRASRQQAWQEAIDAITASDGVTASTLYAHFVLTEHEDLAPIGMDRESKLWEFVHLPSGTPGKEIPRRDPATGRLVPDGDMGIVLVLLPGGKSWFGTTSVDPDRWVKQVAAVKREIAIASGAMALEKVPLSKKYERDSANELNFYAWRRVVSDMAGEEHVRRIFGQEALALSVARAAVAKSAGTPEGTSHLYTLAWALVANGQDEEARQRIAEARPKTPDKELAIWSWHERKVLDAIEYRSARLRAAEAKAAAPRNSQCPNFDPDRSSGEEPHQVELSQYFLSKYEMTQGQWLRLVGANPSRSARLSNLALPVESVTWFECEELLRVQRLSLPTDAQWEAGCRAGTTTPWWTGSDENDLKTKENIGSRLLAAVGSKQPNPFGIFDTHGNLHEWCFDRYGGYQPPRQGDGLLQGGSRSKCSVRRGDYLNGPEFARAGIREGDFAYERAEIRGLRPARASRL